MDDEHLRELEKQAMKKRRERINKAHWADLTYDEVLEIDDKEKMRTYLQNMRKFHIQIINPLANSVSKKFKFSKLDSEITYRMMFNEYMKYFYGRGLSWEEIKEMMIKNKTILSKQGRKK